MNTTRKTEQDFSWSVEQISLSILMGVAAVAGIWVAAGLLATLFL